MNDLNPTRTMGFWRSTCTVVLPWLFRPFAKRLYCYGRSQLGGANFAGHTADAPSNHRTGSFWLHINHYLGPIRWNISPGVFHGSMVKILRPRALQENRVQVAPLVTSEANWRADEDIRMKPERVTGEDPGDESESFTALSLVLLSNLNPGFTLLTIDPKRAVDSCSLFLRSGVWFEGAHSEEGKDVDIDTLRMRDEGENGVVLSGSR